ncbi:MAG: kynureninase [Candidatus Dormibacteria bacterium]|jgi:kynureninase
MSSSDTPRLPGPLPAAESSLRDQALLLDREDPIGWARDRFLVGSDRPIYLDGNSLGMLPRRSVDRMRHLMEEEWGRGLVRSWDSWMHLPAAVGDLLGDALLGAGPGQTVVSDATTVNLYKLASAALDARPGRSVIVSDRSNFPTDRYLLEGLARARGLILRLVDFPEVEGPSPEGLAPYLDSATALVSLSHVDYRSGALADMGGINQVVHAAGALVLWDLCHSVGALPVELDRSGTDLAAGCTYKYLNGGPGSPAFLYVRSELQPSLRQPIWGWFGQVDQFAMGQGYNPVEGIGRFQSGSPQVVAIAMVEEGAKLLAEIGIDQIRAKSIRLTELFIDRFSAWLAPLDFQLMTPQDPDRRGSQVCLRHTHADRICRDLIEEGSVVCDFRAPDRLRLGLAAPTTRFIDVHDAAWRIRELATARTHLE